MSKLLLFSLLALCTTAFAQEANSGLVPSVDNSAATSASPFAGMPQGLSPFGDSQGNVSEQSRTCLRIHAFIFRTDDDRVPTLIRDTTCMPFTAGAKKADFVRPKLKPADGSNRF